MDRIMVMSWLEGLTDPDWSHFHSDSEVQNIALEALSLLEQDCHNCKLECLLGRYDQLKEKYDALLKEQEHKDKIYHALEDDWKRLKRMLKEQEVKAGKWIPITSPTGVEAFGVKEMTVMDVRCSVCGSEEDVSFTGYKYCPRCGAKMEGEVNEIRSQTAETD